MIEQPEAALALLLPFAPSQGRSLPPLLLHLYCDWAFLGHLCALDLWPLSPPLWAPEPTVATRILGNFSGDSYGKL